MYAIVLREHMDVVKVGRTTSWKSRRREYDTWNFASGDGIYESAVYCITEEYADLNGIENACIEALNNMLPKHRGNEWFRGSIHDARKVIEDVLSAAGLSYIETACIKT